MEPNTASLPPGAASAAFREMLLSAHPNGLVLTSLRDADDHLARR